jgi:di/tricarboxylate transporter
MLSGRDFYALIEWKVIVLLACLIPVGRRAGGDRRHAN